MPDVGKVELIGLQDEKIWIELSQHQAGHARRAAGRGAGRRSTQQNAVVPAGFFETGTDRVQLRVSGAFDSVEEIRDFPIRAGDRTFRLGDVADGAPRLRRSGGAAHALHGRGRDRHRGVDEGRRRHPRAWARRCDARVRAPAEDAAGRHGAAQGLRPAARRCSDSVGEFVRVLAEAVAIVLLVSFFSLGFRTGLVVALSIPLVLAMTFAAMHYFGIGLHKISLGALVLALGLLVDDAIIAVEMMAVKMEQGFDRMNAAALRLRSHRVPDADRHAGHRGRLPADRHRGVEHRRIHALDLPGGDDRAAGVVGRGGGVHSRTSATSCCPTGQPRRRSRSLAARGMIARCDAAGVRS